MTTYIACSRRASDAELVAILAETVKSEGRTTWCLVETVRLWASRAAGSNRTTWCFVEGPTRCEFAEPAEVVRHATPVATLWQVRLFAEAFEVAARRCNFQDDQPWIVRWVAPTAPTGNGWSEPVNLPPGKSQSLLLYGQANAEGRFRDGRFLRAALRYPGGDWNKGDQAVLITEIHALDDSAIVRWKQIARYTEDLGDPHREKSQ